MSSSSGSSFPISSSASLPSVSRRRGFSVVLAIELWERFGYYGMQAVLVIFMVEHLHLSDTNANLMQGAFAMLAYSLPVMGGVMGDYLIGTRGTLVMGAVGLTSGYGLLAVSLGHPVLFLPALALIALGNGLFKPNAGALVRRIYEGDETALDAAFTLYYMSINVGSTISMLLMPWLQLCFGPAIAFAGCAAGLLVGLGYYIWRSAWLKPFFQPDHYEMVEGAGPLEQALGHLQARSPEGLFDNIAESSLLPLRHSGILRSSPVMYGGLVLLLCALWGLAVAMLAVPVLARFCVMMAGIGLFYVWGVLYKRAGKFEKTGLLLTYLLCLQTVAYQIFYQQMQTSLTLFALRAVSGSYKIGSVTLFQMSAGQFQALNPIWIMIFSPILAWFYQKRAKKSLDVALSLKLLFGYICVSMAFLLWWLSTQWASHLVSPWIMVAGYGVMSLGELLTIGLGLAIIARYAPARVSALLMGTLFLLWGIGMYAGSLVANLAALPVRGGAMVQPVFYAPLFRGLFIGAALFCVVLFALLPLVARLDRRYTHNMAAEKDRLAGNLS